MNAPAATTGSFTMPTEKGLDHLVVELAATWGADAIRDSDGTELSPDLMKLGFEVFSTLALVRYDQAWAKQHPDHAQQKYLMAGPTLATGGELRLPLLAGYSDQQFQIDAQHDPKEWWEVIDRTSGAVLPLAGWSFDAASGAVVIAKPAPFHQYTVAFLVFQVWETTSMYNHLTNGWTGVHQRGLDPRHPETRAQMLKDVDRFIDEKPQIGWVRFTSMFYQFPIVSDDKNNARFKDWCGYLDTVSVAAIRDFEKEHGYRPRPEQFVQAGTYNTTKMVPTPFYREWVAFIDRYVHALSKDCVATARKRGKKSVLFFCDHWIGTEPYADNFQEIGYDGIVGPVINGRELRRIADVPAPVQKELRLYPYFFPVNLRNEPCFKEGGEPVKEGRAYWMAVRRSLLQAPVDRIGFGGYLSLVQKYPDFIAFVTRLADEFRAIKAASGMQLPQQAPFRLAVLTAWGKTRPWMYDQTWPDGGFFESLAGLPVAIDWISFEDLRRDGVPPGTGVLLSAGDAGSSWSGGSEWLDGCAQARIREFVWTGGGFVGLLDPSACWKDGKLFQLRDVLGFDRETGQTLDIKWNVGAKSVDQHFITADGVPPLGRLRDGVFACSTQAEILAKQDGLIALGTNRFGQGRAVYFAGFKLGASANRLAQRALYWAAGKEDTLQRSFAADPRVDCAYYPATGRMVIVNSSSETVETQVFDQTGKTSELELPPHGQIIR